MSPNIQRSGLTRRAQVMLQAMREEPPLNSKCKDKFLIQSMLIPPEKAAIPLHDLVRRFLRKPLSPPDFSRSGLRPRAKNQGRFTPRK